MLRILWNSKSAMIANQEKLDAISNNLANVNTDGYKRVDVSFKDLMYETLDRKGYPVTENVNSKSKSFTGTGVKTSELMRDNTQGSLRETDKSTDLAIDGEGYFQVTRPDGTQAYTRAGSFQIDSSGRLTDSNGNLLEIKYNPGVDSSTVKFTENNFSVNNSGEILIKENGTYSKIGRIPVFGATGSEAFKSDGENLYTVSDNSQVFEVTNSNVVQGYAENSNVDIAQEMTDMILTQRAFELGSRGIKTADEMWSMVNNLREK